MNGHWSFFAMGEQCGSFMWLREMNSPLHMFARLGSVIVRFVCLAEQTETSNSDAAGPFKGARNGRRQ